MSNDIQEKVWNIELVVKDIKQIPQTYDTILQDEYDNKTMQVILRRKINNLCKAGTICKATIPGTRFGKVIFYVIPKKYYILIEAGRIASQVYYFYEYEKVSKYYILVKECWRLKDGRWQKCYDKKFFDGNVLKWI